VDTCSPCADAVMVRPTEPPVIEIVIGAATVRVPAGTDAATLPGGAARADGSDMTSAAVPAAWPRWCVSSSSTIHSRGRSAPSAEAGGPAEILARDGSGLVLFWKRLEHGPFRWHGSPGRWFDPNRAHQ